MQQNFTRFPSSITPRNRRDRKKSYTKISVRLIQKFWSTEETRKRCYSTKDRNHFFFPLLRNLYHLFREMGCKLVVSMPSFIITNFPLSITHTFFYLSLSLGQHEVSLIRTVSNKEAFPHFLPFPLLLSFIFLPCSILGMGTWCICAY